MNGFQWKIAISTALCLPMLAAADEKEGNGPLKVDPIVGAWVTVITVRDCVSGTPFFSFNGGTLIAHGGTLTTTDYEPNPSKGGPGYGYWFRDKDGAYFRKFQFARFNPDGTLAGFQRVTATTQLGDPDHVTSIIKSEALDPSHFVVATRCATEIGERFK